MPGRAKADRLSTEQVVEEYRHQGGNISRAAKALGCERSNVVYHIRKAGVKLTRPGGVLAPTKIKSRAVPSDGVKRYILTCAQNNTKVNVKVWDNLRALASYWDAELLCASYTYNINAYGKLSVKRGTQSVREDLWYDERVTPYLERSDQFIELAPGLVWCGKMNTLPTAKRPLQGFESYTGRKSGIFPHAKLAMESVASGKSEPTKFNYTTGTVTQINYIQKTAGQRAEHHHNYGGLVVEVDQQGRWFVRQLSADRDGVIQDLDLMVEDGVITTGNVVEAITWGDVHVAQIDPIARELAWAPGGMLDTLQPIYQFLHDVLDFRARNHHDRRNPHRQYELYLRGQDSVEREIEDVVEFLRYVARPWCSSIVVDSNHDGALGRWLRETDWRDDMVNAEFYLEAQRRVLQSIRQEETSFHLFEWAAQRAGAPKTTRFLREDEDFVICHVHSGGIECGMHGHLGLDGGPGSPSSFVKTGRSANTAHTHRAGIMDNVYTAGHTTSGRQHYRRGLSAWSQSHIVTYPSAKRAIVTMWDGKWRA